MEENRSEAEWKQSASLHLDTANNGKQRGRLVQTLRTVVNDCHIACCTMSVLPPELWNKIFTFACMDSGATGRALGLVSSAFHDLVHPLALQSLAVQGFK